MYVDNEIKDFINLIKSLSQEQQLQVLQLIRCAKAVTN